MTSHNSFFFFHTEEISICCEFSFIKKASSLSLYSVSQHWKLRKSAHHQNNPRKTQVTRVAPLRPREIKTLFHRHIDLLDIPFPIRCVGPGFKLSSIREVNRKLTSGHTRRYGVLIHSDKWYGSFNCLYCWTFRKLILHWLT